MIDIWVTCGSQTEDFSEMEIHLTLKEEWILVDSYLNIDFIMREGPVRAVNPDQFIFLEFFKFRISEDVHRSEFWHCFTEIVIGVYSIQGETNVKLQLIIIQPKIAKNDILKTI